MKRAITAVIVLAVLGLIGWRIYSKVTADEDSDRGRGQRAVPIEATPVRQQTIRDIAEFTGSLLPKSQFIVAPKIPGRLEKLLVNIGDLVKDNSQIASLDSEEYAQQVAQATAQLDVSRANLVDAASELDAADRDFKRVKELREQKVASEAELDQAEARYRTAQAKQQVAEAQIKQREAELRAANARLAYTQIEVSWDDGDTPRVVAERFVDEGAMLKANDPIVSIVDVSSVIAVLYVIERDFPQISSGRVISIITDAYPNKEFTGEIVRRAPVLKTESRQARVEIEIPNPERLLAPGMFARVRIQFAEHDNAIVVPATCLVRRDDKQGVFVVDTEQMKARFVPVTTGIIEGNLIEILEPQLDGLVVTLGQHLIEDGAGVALPQRAPMTGSEAGAARRADPGSRP
ncbi:MAG: efflux RND transporter periplasmic adaptor subunit [Verrucomicrobia bacterium]|nr:efflux RND transporter periplasmic adaptor subunit [Verrucomicrobiota bacterium]